ncbi:hypothetical protein ACA910_019245 [Epithemia clementina (nom. ined.)]
MNGFGSNQLFMYQVQGQPQGSFAWNSISCTAVMSIGISFQEDLEILSISSASNYCNCTDPPRFSLDSVLVNQRLCHPQLAANLNPTSCNASSMMVEWDVLDNMATFDTV